MAKTDEKKTDAKEEIPNGEVRLTPTSLKTSSRKYKDNKYLSWAKPPDTGLSCFTCLFFQPIYFFEQTGPGIKQENDEYLTLAGHCRGGSFDPVQMSIITYNPQAAGAGYLRHNDDICLQRVQDNYIHNSKDFWCGKWVRTNVNLPSDGWPVPFIPG